MPWLSSTTPRPPQFEQTLGVVPGLAPEPWHVEHWASAVRYNVVVSPRTASAKSSVSSALTSAPRCGPTPLARPSAAAAAAEHLPEQVADAAALHVADVEREATGAATHATAAHRPEAADLVVLLALGLVTEHVVGGRHFLESLLRNRVTGVLVGVQLACQLAVGLGDVLRCGIVLDAEHLVVVLLEPLALCGHAHSPPLDDVLASMTWPSQSRVRTIAGRRVRPFQR